MQFTQDWFTRHIPQWKKVLQERNNIATVGCEVGSFEGRSATWLCENILTHPDSYLVCVDPFQESNSLLQQQLDRAKNVFLENTRSWRERQKIRWAEETSYEYLRHCEESFDFIYIDGSHFTPHVLTDCVLAFHRLKPAGIMILDDYLWHNRPFPPKQAIDSFIICFETELSVLWKGEQVCVKRLR